MKDNICKSYILKCFVHVCRFTFYYSFCYVTIFLGNFFVERRASTENSMEILSTFFIIIHMLMPNPSVALFNEGKYLKLFNRLFSVSSRMQGASCRRHTSAKRMQPRLKINPGWSVVSSKNAKRHRPGWRGRDFETKVWHFRKLLVAWRVGVAGDILWVKWQDNEPASKVKCHCRDLSHAHWEILWRRERTREKRQFARNTKHEKCNWKLNRVSIIIPGTI